MFNSSLTISGIFFAFLRKDSSPMPSVPETPAFTPEKPKEDLFFEMPSLPTGTGYTAKPNNLNTSNNAEFELPNFPF